MANLKSFKNTMKDLDSVSDSEICSTRLDQTGGFIDSNSKVILTTEVPLQSSQTASTHGIHARVTRASNHYSRVIFSVNFGQINQTRRAYHNIQCSSIMSMIHQRYDWSCDCIGTPFLCDQVYLFIHNLLSKLSFR